MPLLAMRLAAPSILVDLQHVPNLSDIEDRGDHIRIGARVTHREIERSALLADRLPILSAAASHIAHPQIRSRGTFGGSTAHADPSGEWPTILLALSATMQAVGPHGNRTIEADDFFVGPFTSTLRDDEILTHVSIPTTRTAWSFQEAAVKKGDYGLALIAATGTPRGGVLVDPRVTVGAAVGSVTRLVAVERILTDEPLTDELAEEAAVAAAESVKPISDIHGSSDYRRKLVASLVRRAVVELKNGA
ncbi:carbon-monoxide dehydrogenase medium subunit [Nocardioides alpinus]|uniref:Carbon-monoxide dehydrogenase medium subunit n=2 Tax=Nocardioidaceae TaxID=85015 RepID=A0A1I1BB69_9ACTN|nr:carbon-monoxide dehydrogenase medium subunit [Nocardioides alpinus]